MLLLFNHYYSLFKLIILFILLLFFIVRKIVGSETAIILVYQDEIDINDNIFPARIKIDSIVSMALVDSIPEYKIDSGTFNL